MLISKKEAMQNFPNELSSVLLSSMLLRCGKQVSGNSESTF